MASRASQTTLEPIILPDSAGSLKPRMNRKSRLPARHPAYRKAQVALRKAPHAPTWPSGRHGGSSVHLSIGTYCLFMIAQRRAEEGVRSTANERGVRENRSTLHRLRRVAPSPHPTMLPTDKRHGKTRRVEERGRKVPVLCTCLASQTSHLS